MTQDALRHYKIQKLKHNTKKYLDQTFGWLFLLTFIFSIFILIHRFSEWNKLKSDYITRYPLSTPSGLFYETNTGNVPIETVYNLKMKKITPEIPEGKTAIMYCHKDRPNECIYFKEDNTLETGMLDIVKAIFILPFLLSLAIYFIRPFKKHPIYNLGSIFIVLFTTGLICIYYSVSSIIEYNYLKNHGATTTATYYSEIYNQSANRKNNSFKPVAYYYVDGQKYIYVSDLYIKRNESNQNGNSFELYYDTKKPEKTATTLGFERIITLLIGIGFLILAALGTFSMYKKRNLGSEKAPQPN